MISHTSLTFLTHITLSQTSITSSHKSYPFQAYHTALTSSDKYYFSHASYFFSAFSNLLFYISHFFHLFHTFLIYLSHLFFSNLSPFLTYFSVFQTSLTLSDTSHFFSHCLHFYQTTISLYITHFTFSHTYHFFSDFSCLFSHI